MAGGADLAGLAVVVTRPAHQAEPLCRLIEQHGGEAIRFPTLAIEPPRDPAAVRRQLRRLTAYRLLIFTSTNAVDHALELAGGDLPQGPLRAAVGRATAERLAHWGYPPSLLPEGDYSSQGLLNLPALQQVQGRSVAILRGEGGLGLLGDTLGARGAQVNFIEVYRRVRPESDPAPLNARGLAGEIGAVVVTSNEALRNLFDIVGEPGQQWLPATPLVVLSPRARQEAQALGLGRTCIIARQASDTAVLEALHHT